MKEFWKQKLSSRKFWVAVARAAYCAYPKAWPVDSELMEAVWPRLYLRRGRDIARARYKNEDTPDFSGAFLVYFKKYCTKSIDIRYKICYNNNK